MIEIVRQKAGELLNQGKIKGFIAPSRENGHVAPRLFTRVEELSTLNLGDSSSEGDARYPLDKILITLHRKYPDDCFGILVRGCDQRGLYTLYRLNQLNPDRVIEVGIACSPGLAKACECLKPFPDDAVAGDPVAPEGQKAVEMVEDMDMAGRFEFWMDQFSKCVKCYGCRDICPMCFCNECSLECKDLVSKGDLPVDIPVFHLVRAMHMADRCIDCGLCEEACPSDIPLRTLYKKTGRIMDEEFGFTSGINKHEKSPLSIMGPAPDKKGP
ncbi:MAG: 4Fe-4S ferredoxin [Desulfobacteraceae bacterium]|nr:MAG: 4Fe-4S ferredoxin [Desulfobacteraceae bacterium]